MEYIVKAPAKINLSLDITGKRQDGYHLLSTVMQTIELFDILTIRIDDLIKFGDEKIIVSTNMGYIPSDTRNTAYKAANLFMSRYKNIVNSNRKENSLINKNPQNCTFTPKRIEIHIEKKIPVQAGLGGGSSDAAGVLVGMNNAFGQIFSMEELLEMGVLIGADVPFCIRGGTVYCEGIGEIMTPLKNLPDINILIVKPGFGVSTPWIFKNYKPELIFNRPDTKKVLESIEVCDLKSLFSSTSNVLEEITVLNYPEIIEIKQALINCGASFSMMSGSGSAVFGVFNDIQNAERAYEKLSVLLQKFNPSLFLTKTCSNGPALVKNANPY